MLRCRVTHGPWREVAEAVIRDLDENGARLRLTSRTKISGRLLLEVQPSGTVYTADVVWQRDDQIGVRLVATLDQAAEQQIEALRRLEAEMRLAIKLSAPDEGY